MVFSVEEIPKPDPAPPLRVGLTFNLKHASLSDSEDEQAEYDRIETVDAIRAALETAGCRVELMEAADTLPRALSGRPVDIVFNIAEGSGGRGREAQIPSLLSFLRIPSTGSDETTLCVALDKALSKRLLATYQVKTPRYRVVHPDSRWKGGLSFPVIVKPVAEGSSKGIFNKAVAENETQLKELLEENFARYRQDMLVEEYIGGREFTVGILGNGAETRVFRPMEIVYLDRESAYHIYSFQVKKNYKTLIRYDCPAAIPEKTERELMDTARKIYDALECRDFARVDFRLSPEGTVYFIEINPLPGLEPGYSDFPMLAERNGMDYVALVRGVLNAALKRHGLEFCLEQG